jgi:hypothetical protein
MALDEREEMKEHMEETDEQTGEDLDDRRMQVGHLCLCSAGTQGAGYDSNTVTCSSCSNPNRDISLHFVDSSR